MRTLGPSGASSQLINELFVMQGCALLNYQQWRGFTHTHSCKYTELHRQPAEGQQDSAGFKKESPFQVLHALCILGDLL